MYTVYLYVYQTRLHSAAAETLYLKTITYRNFKKIFYNFKGERIGIGTLKNELTLSELK